MFNNALGAINMTNSILRLPAVKDRIKLSRSTIYLLISKGKFPSPISLGERAVGWLEEDVENWLKEKIEASRTAN
jgi:prophage regulatory protein